MGTSAEELTDEAIVDSTEDSIAEATADSVTDASDKEVEYSTDEIEAVDLSADPEISVEKLAATMLPRDKVTAEKLLLSSVAEEDTVLTLVFDVSTSLERLGAAVDDAGAVVVAAEVAEVAEAECVCLRANSIVAFRVENVEVERAVAVDEEILWAKTVELEEIVEAVEAAVVTVAFK